MAMADNTTDGLNLQRDSRQLADSIAQLTGELKELKKRKKAFLAEMNPAIKELEDMLEFEQEQWEKMRALEGGD